MNTSFDIIYIYQLRYPSWKCMLDGCCKGSKDSNQWLIHARATHNR